MILALLAVLTMQPAVCPDARTPEFTECKAQLAIARGDHLGAAEHFLTIVDLVETPQDKARAYAAAAPLFAIGGQVERAEEVAAAALALNALPPLQQGWTRLDHAQALFRLGRRDEAEAEWAGAAQAIGEDPYYWWTGASMALTADRPADARTRVDEGLRRAPQSPELLLLSGQVALAVEDLAAARTAFAAAAAAAPDSPPGRNAARALAAMGAQ